MLGASSTCVTLQSRVTSSGATVKSWMWFFLLLLLFVYFLFIKFLFFYLIMYLFCTFSPLPVCFACFCFVAVDFFYFLLAYLCMFVCVSVCVCECVCLCVLLSLSFFFFPLFFLCAVFISLRVGLGLILRWSETKISYFGVVYKLLSVGMELAVIKELFIILYIYCIYFLTNLF